MAGKLRKKEIAPIMNASYQVEVLPSLRGKVCRFPFSPRENVFEADCQPWQIVEVSGIKLFIAVSHITKRIVVGVFDA